MTTNQKSRRYFRFLNRLIGQDKAKVYSILINYLHSVTFEPLIPNDDNREEDGLQLRDQYLDEEGPTGPSSLPDEPCSMLEMMIGLSKRMEFELGGGQYEHPAAYWFWVLIDNLNLTLQTDDNYRRDLPASKDYMEVIVYNLVHRTYSRNGDGGLFPVHKTRKDQRRVEIWYQMNTWIMENYPI